MENNKQVFLALVRAGLWEQDVWLLPFKRIEYKKIYQFAESQTVVGLVAAGLEHVVDSKVPQDVALSFVSATLQIEQRNVDINAFVAKLIKRLRRHDIYGLLVKGQGVAQCYERPLWRASGDVDLLFSDENYEKAKDELLPIAYDVQKEVIRTKHQAFSIMGFEVELHGKMPFTLSNKGNKLSETIVKDCFSNGSIRVWSNGGEDVFLPAPDNDVILVFNHFLLHFFIEGVGLRQICDWCRLLWTYRQSLNQKELEKRIREAGLMSEWKTFASLAVEYLGMPVEAMPLYSDNLCYRWRCKKVLERIMRSGNFGYNNDLSYRVRYSGVLYLVISFCRRLWDFMRLFLIFPIDSPKFFVAYILSRKK